MEILDVSTDGSIIYYTEEDGKIVLRHEHPDVEAVKKANAELSASRGRFDKKGDMHHIMRVPAAILTKICAETGLNFFDQEDAKKILAILKSPEYRDLRTYSGQI